MSKSADGLASDVAKVVAAMIDARIKAHERKSLERERRSMDLEAELLKLVDRLERRCAELERKV